MKGRNGRMCRDDKRGKKQEEWHRKRGNERDMNGRMGREGKIRKENDGKGWE